MADEPCSGWDPTTSLCSDWGDYDGPTQAYALEVAKTVIWAATGRRFGLCPVTVRPCSREALPLYLTFPVTGFWGLASIGSGVVLSALEPCACGPSCGCSVSEVRLPGPVHDITSVVVDGVMLAASDYRLDPGGLLVRVDGENWPAGQDLSLATTEANTWAVTYRRGEAVPTGLNMAAGIYACELAAARTGGECRLPSRIQTVTRQGVTVDLVNDEAFLDKGRTGVPEVDQLIVAYNPKGIYARPRVASPDLPHMR